MSFSGLITVILFFVLAQGDPAQVKQAFLADTARMPEFLALASHPDLFQDRQVQIKIVRSLGSTDIEVFKAAMALCLKAHQLEGIPMVERRFSTAFLSQEATKKKVILDLAQSDPSLLKDLRVISFISQSLLDSDAEVAKGALAIARADKSLQENPAIAEALMSLSEKSPGPAVKLPAFETFKQTLHPIFEAPGEDGNACVNCHGTHPILRLSPVMPTGDREQQLRDQYRATLRVIDLKAPENSLILIKPTQPAPTDRNSPPSPETHGGGARFDKNSAQYKAILEWINSAKK